MAPPDRGGTQDGADKYKTAPDAKHLLDMIGKDVHDLVKSESNGFKDDLKGDLNTANGHTSELVSTDKTCDLVKEYISKVGATNSDPCTNLSGKVEPRFSNTLGGQCTREKISGSTSTCGACAPYRRLHLCHHNLESIDTKSTTTNKLLLEVCLAAKHEGETLTTQHGQHKLDNNNSSSQLCTVLARSFADIGDIVRGKDLFLGNDKEKDQRKQLDDKLKKIFGKIYEGLTTTRGKNAEELQERYKKDEENYYQLREDWWDANRATIWEAITCGVHGSDYFRATCGGDGKHSTLAKNNCRCKDEKGKNDTDQVPTYFDYVPQYLRWFEEWAEDFCRLRKRKLEDAKSKCRGENGEEKYCSGNGFDCKETVRGDEHFVEKDCHDCSYSCSPFVKWIDNQKLEFLKQKKKYKSEIKKYTNGESRTTGGSKRKKRDAGKSNYDGYEKKFYDILKGGYKDVGKFLQLLNNETTCTKNTEIKEGGNIDFKNVNSAKNSDGNNKTFSRTEICEPCPWCGIEEQKVDGKWKAKNNGECAKVENKIYDPKKTTTIEILTGDNEKFGIYEKYNKFCANGKNGVTSGAPDTAPGKNGNQIVTWQCYYDKKKRSGQNNDNCVEGTWEKFTGKQTVKSYNVFFWDWVYHMLHDSLEWRERLNSCINNAKSQNCKNNKCNRECGCFAKWVVKKKDEWDKIKDHFNKQENIGQNVGFIEFNHYGVLEGVLDKDELLKNIKDTHADAKDIERIDKMLQQAGVVGGGRGGENNTIIDKFLQEEERFAKDCQQKQEECNRQQENTGAGRSATFTPSKPTAPTEEEDEEEEEEEEDEDEDGDEVGGEEETAAEALPDETEVVEETVAKTTTPSVEVCKIVETLFKDGTTLKNACPTKYGSKAPTSWKCVPTTSGGSGEATGSDTTGGDKDGAICIPPRRRRLYVGKLEQWASDETQSKSLETSGQKTPSGDKLRDAFIQSAAIETFFLWHKYKAENTKRQGVGVAPGIGVAPPGGPPPLPRTSLTLGNGGPNGELSPPGVGGVPGVGALGVGGAGIPGELGGLAGVPGQAQLQPLPKLGPTVNGDPDDPEYQLKQGRIPEDFLRQMFYTLADYKDILEGKNDILIGKTGTGSTKDEIAQREKTIKEKIASFFQNGNKEGTPHVPKKPGQTTTKPEDWWQKNGEHIWNGMICALTYTDSEQKGDDAKPTEDPTVKKAFFGTQNGSPLPQPVTASTPTGTYTTRYQYDKVVLKDESSETQARTNDTINNPKLSDFVLRPPYFRYLEEWGQHFCKERMKRLEEIKDDCYKDRGATKQYSGDGETCNEVLPKNDGTVHSLEGQSCADSCKSYKKWIQKKKIEFEEQSNAYSNQKENCKKESKSAEGNNHGNEFCVTVNTCNTAAAFLQKLGPCKKDNDDNEIGEGKKIFDDKDKTFVPATNCKPCSQFKIDCQNGNCGADTNGKCNGKTTITANHIGNGRNSAEDIDMLVSDNSPNGFEDDLDECLLPECADADIFQGIRKDEWTCEKVCGYVVCKPKKVNGETVTKEKDNGKHIVQIRALLRLWLEYFLEDYKKIKHKISHCIKNDDGSKCIKVCDNKCKCVEKWIKLKRDEWKTIKDRFNDQYKMDSDEYYPVKTILEELIPQITDVNEKEKVIKISKFDNSCGCSADANSQKNDGNQDAIDCMLKKLEQKATSCQEQHSGEPCDTTPLEDDDPLEETEENQVKAPEICPNVDTTEEEQTDEKCDSAPTTPKETVPS
ncbi:hypothetical protein PFFVO_00828, partial [Plasmodium falciparum Vietnam Oak-Knoll (FVO)]